MDNILSGYNDKFYKNRSQLTKQSADKIIKIVKKTIPRVYSAIDFGCRIGMWLSVLKKEVAKTVCEIDDSWVNKMCLETNSEEFIKRSFAEWISVDINMRFDLALSLEVVEHLSASQALGFVHTLTKIRILFFSLLLFHFKEDDTILISNESTVGLIFFEKDGFEYGYQKVFKTKMI